MAERSNLDQKNNDDSESKSDTDLKDILKTERKGIDDSDIKNELIDLETNKQNVTAINNDLDTDNNSDDFHDSKEKLTKTESSEHSPAFHKNRNLGEQEIDNVQNLDEAMQSTVLPKSSEENNGVSQHVSNSIVDGIPESSIEINKTNDSLEPHKEMNVEEGDIKLDDENIDNQNEEEMDVIEHLDSSLLYQNP
uniref:Uncharacterized protein n=1 Tax=Meloidogyne javanica TaxID=6303 RepID=A0A915MUQ9_MELJA